MNFILVRGYDEDIIGMGVQDWDLKKRLGETIGRHPARLERNTKETRFEEAAQNKTGTTRTRKASLLRGQGLGIQVREVKAGIAPARQHPLEVGRAKVHYGRLLRVASCSSVRACRVRHDSAAGPRYRGKYRCNFRLKVVDRATLSHRI